MSLNESINWLINDIKEKDYKLENIKALVKHWEDKANSLNNTENNDIVEGWRQALKYCKLGLEEMLK